MIDPGYAIVLVGDGSVRHLAEKRQSLGPYTGVWSWWVLCGAHVRRPHGRGRIRRLTVYPQRGQLADVSCGLCMRVRDNEKTGARRFITQHFMPDPTAIRAP